MLEQSRCVKIAFGGKKIEVNRAAVTGLQSKRSSPARYHPDFFSQLWADKKTSAFFVSGGSIFSCQIIFF